MNQILRTPHEGPFTETASKKGQRRIWSSAGTLPITADSPRIFTGRLHRNPPEPHQVSAPETSGYMHQNPLEPHQVSAPLEPSRTVEPPQVSSQEPFTGTSGAIWTGTFETSPAICTVTLWNLVRNLVLKRNQIACTQKLLHTDAITHRRFYTQTLLHTDAFTHIAILLQFLALQPHFVRQGRAKGSRGTSWNRNFTSVFADRTSFRAKGLRRTTWNRNFTSVLDDRTSFRAKGLRRTSWNHNFTSVFGDQTSFRAKGLRRTSWNRNFTSVLDDRTSFRAKGLRGTSWNRNFTSVFDDRTSFRAKGLRGTSWNRNFTSVFDDRTSFRAKGLRRTTWNRNFTSVFGDQTSFRANGSRFVPSRCHCPRSRLQERNRKEGEGKRARGQEEKVWDEKM